MASSQVEIALSSQRFGFVLRDRNQPRNDNNDVVLKDLVKDHHRRRRYHHQILDSGSCVENNDENNRIQVKENPISNFSEKSKQITRVLAPIESSNSRDLTTREIIVSRRVKSEDLKRKDNLGNASSLVQIWEARLNRSNVGNSSPSHGQSTENSGRSSSDLSVEDTHFSISPPSIHEESESADEEEATENESKNSDRTVEIESRSNDSISDSGESSWGRVADLIKRLTNDEKLDAGNNGVGIGGGGCGGGLQIIGTPRDCISSCLSMSEKRDFPVVAFSPRIRGRQAFSDLLIQLERDRHRELDLLLERNAVSRFSQRGRLQSMLRLRTLKRCLAIQDQNQSKAKSAVLNRFETGSAVLQFREKFQANTVHATATAEQRKGSHHQSTELTNKTVTKEETTEKSRLKKGGFPLEPSVTERLNLQNRMLEEATLCKAKETVNETVESKMNHLKLQETREKQEEKAFNGNKSENKEDKTSQILSVTQESRLKQNSNDNEVINCVQEAPETENNNQKIECLELQGTQGTENTNQMNQCLEEQETLYMNGWEEYEDEQSYYGETNNDWLIEIARPRSYWEELRKSRYLEVMNTRSGKEDIRRLLERKTVSGFLESGLREMIDKIIMSRVLTHSTQQIEAKSENWEEEKGEIEEEEDERDHDSSRSSSPMFAPSPAGSWSSQDTGVTSSPVLTAHIPNSPEMEIISDLKSLILQLQQDMSELRDSVKTCLNANASLQQSVHQENPLNRKCCVCNQTQVEAVLYRCGHMCACLKCANELQWSGGKCPICRAKIVDVVRVFFDNTRK